MGALKKKGAVAENPTEILQVAKFSEGPGQAVKEEVAPFTSRETPGGRFLHFPRFHTAVFLRVVSPQNGGFFIPFHHPK